MKGGRGVDGEGRGGAKGGGKGERKRDGGEWVRWVVVGWEDGRWWYGRWRQERIAGGV